MLSTTNLNHIFIIKTYWAITLHIKELNPSNHNSTFITHSVITVEQPLRTLLTAHSIVTTLYKLTLMRTFTLTIYMILCSSSDKFRMVPVSATTY